ncbi:MAG TPA: hypothetical protein V6D10_20855 [Trichocoleus sp.]|jgi:hypothetical protein
MSEFHHHIVPIPQADVAEIFTVYQTSHAFYEEVQSRQAWEDHCAWYAELAEQHRRDLAKMQREINIISWFYGRKR